MAESLDITNAPEIACVTEIHSSINQINLNTVRIYPNPSEEFIRINSAFQITDYSIYNSNGSEFIQLNYVLTNQIRAAACKTCLLNCEN